MTRPDGPAFTEQRLLYPAKKVVMAKYMLDCEDGQLEGVPVLSIAVAHDAAFLHL